MERSLEKLLWGKGVGREREQAFQTQYWKRVPHSTLIPVAFSHFGIKNPDSRARWAGIPGSSRRMAGSAISGADQVCPILLLSVTMMLAYQRTGESRNWKLGLQDGPGHRAATVREQS